MLSSFGPWATTGIGSLPFADPAEAVAHVWAGYDMQFSPQLEGRCAWSAERDRVRPAAWPEVLRAVAAVPPSHGVVKLQVPGPCSLAHSLAEVGAAGDGLAQSLGLWLAANAQACAADLAVLGAATLVVVDEPRLSEAGVSPMDAARAWHALSRVGGGWALHVCGAPPWPVIAQAGADALFLDVHRHPLSEAGAAVVRRLIAAGGRVGLGVLPVRGAADGLAVARRAIESLGDPDAVGRAAFLTPACGTGHATPERERELAAGLGEIRSALLEQAPQADPTAADGRLRA